MSKIHKLKTHTYPRLPIVLAAAILASAALAYGQTELTTVSPQQRAQLRLQRPQRLLVAKQALDQQRMSLGLTVDDTFEPVSSTFDDQGGLVVRYARRYKNVRVIGGSVKVAVRPDGTQGSVIRFSPLNVRVLSVAPTVGEAAALQTVAKDLGVFIGELDHEVELAILPAGAGRREPRLAWMVTADAPKAEASVYYIDALTGTILDKDLAHIQNDDVTPGTGNSYYSGQVPLTTRFSQAQQKYKLQDTTRGGTLVYDVEDRKPTSSFHGNPYWHTINTWGNGLDWKPGDSTKGPTGQTVAVDAMHSAGFTWDLLSKVFGREGLNDDGQPMKLRVHVRKDKDNLYGDAHWDGYFANFGDGATSDDPHRARPMTVAHELGHGLWSSLVSNDRNDWKDEARGLNEGHGDITAALMKHYRDLAGATGYVIPTNTPRNMELFYGRSVNPLSYETGGSTGLRWYMPEMGTYEEHLQGCVYGRMFATLAMGAPSWAEYAAGPPCTGASGSAFKCLASPWLQQGMAGIGLHKAAKIWYLATTKFPAKPTFSSVRADYLEAAAELYGANSDEYKSVMNAFRAINVGPEAADTQNPSVSIAAPYVDNQEQSILLNVSGSDDVGVARLELSMMGASKDVNWSSFNGYLSLANTAEGQRQVSAKAFDSMGKMGQTGRNFFYAGANFLINNRGFEGGGTQWTVSPAGLVKSDAAKAFLGSGYVSMTANSSIRQQFTVPAGADYCTIGYRVSVASQSITAPPLQVELMQANGTTVHTLLNNISTSQDTTDATSNNYKRYSHTVYNCAGKTLWIRFRTYSSSADQFRLDNVFVTYSAAPTANFTVDVDEAERTVIFELKNIQNIPPDNVDYVEFGSPGAAGYKDRYAPYYRIDSTANFVVNATYQVKAGIFIHGGSKVYSSPTVPFVVREVNRLINNPGFEPNGVWWTNTGSTGFCSPPGVDQSPLGFQGIGCAWFNGSGTVHQTISIPAGPGQAGLTFRLRIANGTASHSLVVKAENTVTGQSTTLATILGNTNTNAGTSHNGYRKFTYNLSPFMGQTIRIKFQSVDNSPEPMTFYVDNVGVTYKAFGVVTQ